VRKAQYVLSSLFSIPVTSADVGRQSSCLDGTVFSRGFDLFELFF
jgi:hypothetical protein